MVKFYDVEQNTDEWCQLRAGKVGGSSISKVMANYPKAFGKPAKDLAVKLAIEQITGQPQESGYSNEHMQRGHEQEPMARALYEYSTFSTVTNGGFFENGFYGVSPDGLVGEDGLIEIKSVVPHVHYDNVVRGTVDPAYKWQLYFNLMVTELDWIDFVSFCATFPEEKKLYVYRVMREELQEEFNNLTDRLGEFKAMVEDRRTTILNSQYF